MFTFPTHNLVLKFLAVAIRPQVELNGIQIQKEEIKLFINNMILYIKVPKCSILDLIKTFRKVARYKNQHTKFISFSIHQ
jgi:hypothetical protein